jgi:cytidylate kinase
MIITIGRQLGSGGRVIGQKLAEAMQMDCYDREILEITAAQSGLSRKLFEEADEQARKGFAAGIFGSAIRFPGFGDGNFGEGTVGYGGLSNELLFRIQSNVIRDLAERRDCVFIGRCADYILRDRTDCFSIFVCADDDDRLRRILDDAACAISAEKARERMERIDRKRAAYYNYYSNRTWGSAATYHVCINSSVFGIDGAVGLLKEMIEKKFGRKP